MATLDCRFPLINPSAMEELAPDGLRDWHLWVKYEPTRSVSAVCHKAVFREIALLFVFNTFKASLATLSRRKYRLDKLKDAGTAT